MSTSSATRGFGLLEGFLAKKRAAMANCLIAHESRGGRILDIGCGSYPVFLLSIQFAEKIGLDQVADEATTARIAQIDPHIRLMRQDTEQTASLPFEDDFFEVVTMLAVFEHIELAHLIDLLKEVRRVLKPGGAYIMTTPAFWTDGLIKTLARLRLISAAEIDEHQDAYSHKRIAEILVQADFEMDKIKMGYFELGINNWVRAYK